VIRNAIVIDATDTVATLLRDLAKGETVAAGLGEEVVTFPALGDIPFGHKVALHDVAAGAHIVKYGEVIGVATAPIRKGEHVHVQNVASLRGRGDLATEKETIR